MKKGLVSILVVNWNEKEFLESCFYSIFSQSYKNIEVIVVDNASVDGSQALLQKYADQKKIRFIASRKNLGFAGGNNLALIKAKGEYVLLLNADTKFKSDMLSKLVHFLDGHESAGIVQPKLVFMSDNNKLDNVGAYLTYTGIPYYFGLYKKADDPKYNRDLKVFSCKGACMLVRRSVIEKIGFLDDVMFAYFEESDFCHRTWIAGWECWYTPATKVEHYVGATYKKRDNYKTVFVSHRNRIRSFIKNFSAATLVWLLPIHIFSLFGVAAVEFFRGNYQKALATLKGIFASLFILPDTLKQRKLVQSRYRRVKDGQISKYIFKNPRLEYYKYVGGGLENFED